jgi:predicted RNA-binding protein with PIN domain
VFAFMENTVATRLGTVDQVSADIAADVPDEALRYALEFAVGIAAAGAKVRPPLPFPVQLKPFLRFHKLPPTALKQVRAAVEGDDEFRRRLASVATIELIDHVGVLWLSRPDGWEETIATALPDKVVDDTTALRREERRRLAAQAAAARVSAELLGLADELQRERLAKAPIVAERDRQRAELDELRQRLRESQRAEHASAQALAKVESELLEARHQIRESIDLPLAASIDTSVVRSLVEEAASASSEIVRMLADALAELAAGDELPPDPAPPARISRPRRTPIRLPGGVREGTVEAAESLLRTKGSAILIDGYNVAKLGWPALELDQQRERCVSAAENLAKRWHMAMTIVFDGATIEGAHTSTRRRVRIVYSPAGVSADDVLRAEVAAVEVNKPVVLVTNDRAIVTDVAAAGANTVSSDDFLVLLRR